MSFPLVPKMVTLNDLEWRNSRNLQIVGFFKKNLKNPDFRLAVTTQKFLPFSLISCV